MKCTCHAAGLLMFPTLSFADVHELLFGATCWPFGDCADVRKQLRDMADHTDGSLHAALARADSQMEEQMKEVAI
jgi:hypothetical protein